MVVVVVVVVCWVGLRPLSGWLVTGWLGVRLPHTTPRLRMRPLRLDTVPAAAALRSR
jgi:hypothetical protein